MAFGFAQRTTGLIVEAAGGAASPEAARQYLADFARAYADEVDFIRSGSSEPKARIVEAIRDRHCDLLFTLDVTDRALAKESGAGFVPCFPDPALYRSGAMQSWNRVRHASAAKPPARVCVFGPESTGKSTLCADLASHFRALHVTEYVRGYLDATQSGGTAADVPWIARGQRAAEIATAAQVDSLLICDTSLATIMLWSEVLFGAAPGWLRDAALAQTFDLWLLTDIDVPFEPDPQRCFPQTADREWLMRQCRGLLERLGVKPLLLRGARGQRMARACAAIDGILALRL